MYLKKFFLLSLTSLARFSSSKALTSLSHFYLLFTTSVFIPSGLTLVLPSVYFPLTLHQQQEFLVHLHRFLILFPQFLAHQDVSFLRLQEITLEYQPSLLGFSSLHACSNGIFPRFLKRLTLALLKSMIVCCPPSSLPNSELHNLMVTDAAPFTLHISNKGLPCLLL